MLSLQLFFPPCYPAWLDSYSSVSFIIIVGSHKYIFMLISVITLYVFVSFLKDRLSNRHSCLNFYLFAIKLIQSDSLTVWLSPSPSLTHTDTHNTGHSMMSSFKLSKTLHFADQWTQNGKRKSVMLAGTKPTICPGLTCVSHRWTSWLHYP